MSFADHLGELRSRLLRGLAGVAVACVITFYYGYELVDWLCLPLLEALRAHGLPPHLYNFKVMTGLTVFMKVALVFGLLAGGPWVIYQLWMFVAAGLYPRERRIITRMAPFSGLMSIAGAAFMYFVFLPIALSFLIGFSVSYPPVSPVVAGTQPLPTTAPGPAMLLPSLTHDPAAMQEGQVWLKLPENEVRIYLDKRVQVLNLSSPTLLAPLIEIDDYIDFVLWLLLAMAIAFQTPVLMFLLGWTGLVAPAAIARGRKYAIFICFVVAALLTPTPDPMNMTLMALPLWGLFELGLLLMWMSHRRHQAGSAASPPA